MDAILYPFMTMYPSVLYQDELTKWSVQTAGLLAIVVQYIRVHLTDRVWSYQQAVNYAATSLFEITSEPRI